jgi:hypothetical protein
MADALRDALLEFQTPPPLVVIVRLAVALVLGVVVAAVYRTTRPAHDVVESFGATLVLLSILIAMVTQVIGDNVARAFSLVGALSIVRFRTVVRDTQDTAYVIFAVGVGMAVGAGNPWLAAGGIAIVGLASFAMNRRTGTSAPGPTAPEAFELLVRLGIGHDPQVTIGPTLDQHIRERRLMAIATTRQGLAIEATYRTELQSDQAADTLLRALNRVEGVQSVTLRRIELDKPAGGSGL